MRRDGWGVGLTPEHSTSCSSGTSPRRYEYSLARLSDRCGTYVEDCDSSAEEGYSDDYVPAEATDLSDVYDAELIEGDDTDYIGSRYSLDCSLYEGQSRRLISDGRLGRLSRSLGDDTRGVDDGDAGNRCIHRADARSRQFWKRGGGAVHLQKPPRLREQGLLRWIKARDLEDLLVTLVSCTGAIAQR